MRELNKILIAPDKFKDAATADEVAKAIQKGINKADSNLECTLFPLADGGEGSLAILSTKLGGKYKYFTVLDPLFREIEAPVLFHENKAYIEMASASGLQLLHPSERNCFFTSSFGTGQLIQYAIEEGATKIILCIGGSATCDAGMGMAEALGFEFLNENNERLKPIGKNLIEVKNIITPKWIKDKPENISIQVASDVHNPLHGTNGAAQIYAPQKGASSDQTQLLEKGLLNFDKICSAAFSKKLSHIPGAGAAGGIGAGLMWFLNAKLYSGAELIMNSTHFEERLNDHQIVITGEGCLDSQSMSGKVIQKVSEKCNAHKVPVFALCGSMDLTIEEIERAGLQCALSITNHPSSLEKSLKSTLNNLEIAAYNLIKALSI